MPLNIVALEEDLALAAVKDSKKSPRGAGRAGRDHAEPGGFAGIVRWGSDVKG